VPDTALLIGHWGYLAIFVFVILGNMGVPLPEDTILALAGYLVWQGELRLPIVLAVGIVSAVIGDNIGYRIGRKYGQGAIQRYGHWVVGNSQRLETMRGFVTRYGPLGVFAARFLPGLRFLAGPLAGATGLRFFPFLVANVLGASLYVRWRWGSAMPWDTGWVIMSPGWSGWWDTSSTLSSSALSLSRWR
jgi:membrane protein DedA with SNARE-associated domain